MFHHAKTIKTDLCDFQHDLLVATHDALTHGHTHTAYEYAVAYHLTEQYQKPIFHWADLPTAVKDRLGLATLNGADVGLDAVALDCSMSVQAKHYTKTPYVSADDQQRCFLCVGQAIRATKNFQCLQPLLFVTTEGTKLSTPKINYARTLQYKHTFLTHKQFKAICDLAKQYYHTVQQQAALSARFVQLRPCQQQALDAIQKSSQNVFRVRMPCGAGKSWLAVKHFQNATLPRKKALILVPTCILLTQWADLIRAQTKLTIARIGDGYNENPEQRDVTIAVYNSFDKVNPTLYTHVYIDEAHHVQRRLIKLLDDETANDNLSDSDNADSDADVGLQKTYLTAIAQHVRDATIPSTMLLSATLKSKENDVADVLMFDYRMGDAIQDGILTDYIIHNPVFQPNSSQPDFVSYFKKHTEFKHILAYFNRIEDAEQWAENATKCGLAAMSLTTNDTKHKRKEVLTQFKQGHIRILATVNILGEGVDLPIADTCCFIQARHSSYSIIQCVGRVLRQYPGKRIAHIVLPACLYEDENTDLDGYLHSLHGFYRSLCKHDATLKHTLLNATSTAKIAVDFASSSANVGQLLYERILTSTGRYLTRGDLEFHCTLYREYYDAFGEAPKKRTVHRNIKLGKWIDTQRTNYKKDKLTNDVVNRLKALPDWSWEPRKDKFDCNIECYKAYVREYGEAPVWSTRHQDIRLGMWVGKQRIKYKNGKLEDAVIQQLEALPYWSWQPNVDYFNAKIAIYKAYVQEYVESPVQSTYYRKKTLACGSPPDVMITRMES